MIACVDAGNQLPSPVITSNKLQSIWSAKPLIYCSGNTLIWYCENNWDHMQNISSTPMGGKLQAVNIFWGRREGKKILTAGRTRVPKVPEQKRRNITLSEICETNYHTLTKTSTLQQCCSLSMADGRCEISFAEPQKYEHQPTATLFLCFVQTKNMLSMFFVWTFFFTFTETETLLQSIQPSMPPSYYSPLIQQPK